MPEPPNDLDKPYNQTFLEVMRDHLHKTYISPDLGFSRSDYIIYWREDYNQETNEPKDWDIRLDRGKRILVLFNSSPYNGKRNIMLTKRFTAMPKPHLKTLKIGMDILLRKDAIRFYGIELSKVDTNLYHKKNKIDLQHHDITVEAFYIVTIIDSETKKKVSVTVRNCDSFTASEVAFKHLYGED